MSLTEKAREMLEREHAGRCLYCSIVPNDVGPRVYKEGCKEWPLICRALDVVNAAVVEKEGPFQITYDECLICGWSGADEVAERHRKNCPVAALEQEVSDE